MKKISHSKKILVVWMLLTAVIFSHITSQVPFTVQAQETDAFVNKEIMLSYVTDISVDTEGCILRIYGAENKTYRVPISIHTDCTVILDNVTNLADLTVADGVTVQILLRGSNTLNNICAVGGFTTHVYIRGESEESALTASNLVCAPGGSAATGAEVIIENCSVTCARLGCGGGGSDTAYMSGDTKLPAALPGSNASPRVMIRSAEVTVNGSIACGGNGIQSRGTSTAVSSHGGKSGEVIIDASRVTVNGNVAVGGKGGNGVVGSSSFRCTAGNTKSASPVTIRNHSTVIVSGNVASQQDLPQVSNEGFQEGLPGVIVTVSDSMLKAADIASGGDGHIQVHYYIDFGLKDLYNIYGTAGGDGGTLVADHADIICETAVCGGNAGDYMNYTVDENNEKSGDYQSIYHPSDGHGGVIRSSGSNIKINRFACEKGSRWNNYANASSHRDSIFHGGSLDGIVYGSTITTDMTSILGGGFQADIDIQNSKGTSCAGCVLQTSEELAGQTVQVKANDLTANVILDDSGSLHTCLSMEDQAVSIYGTVAYEGTFTVTDSDQLNVFQLEPGGIIRMDQGDVVIREDAYTYLEKTYSYSGAYTLVGNSTGTALTVESGKHHLILQDTSFGTLNIRGDSAVTIQPYEHADIGTVNVESGAALTVAGIGDVCTASDIFTVGECRGVLQNENGTPVRSVTICTGYPDQEMTLHLDDQEYMVTSDDQGDFSFLAAEGEHSIGVTIGDTTYRSVHPFCISGATSGSLSIKDDLTDDDPDTGSGTVTDNDTDSDTGSGTNTDTGIDTGTNTGTGTNTDTSTNTGTGTVPDVSHGGSSQTYVPSAGGTGQSSSSSSSSSSASSSSSNASSGSYTQATGAASKDTPSKATSGKTTTSKATTDKITSDTAASATAVPAIVSPSIMLQASLKGISMLSANAKNTYKLYTRKKKISFTVTREPDTDYYYKILKKGQKSSEGKWKKMSTGKLTVSDSNSSAKGQRIVLKAVNAAGSTIEKTTGFVIDTKKPAVSGVNNGKIYNRKRTISVTDNCGSCEVRLNGKQVKQQFSIQKRGIYLLTASDPAGNQRTVLFAVL